MKFEGGLAYMNTEEVFELVENDLQISPQNIMFIDDTSVNIENARNRGWNTCQAYGYELDKIKGAVEQFLTEQLQFEGKNRRLK